MYRSEISITGLGALALIFVALLASGANSGALAGYFGAGLMGFALVKIATMRPVEVAHLVRAHWLSAFAALSFITLAAFSVIPATAGNVRTWLDHAQLASLSPYRTIEGLAAFMAPLAAFVLGATSGAQSGQRAWNAQVFLIFAIAFSAWALVSHSPSEGTRLSARLGSANTAACVFGMIAVFSAAHLVRALRRNKEDDASGFGQRIRALVRASPLALIALALSMTCVALTLSRGGFVATAAGFAVLGAFVVANGRAQPGRLWVVLSGAVALFGAGVFVLLQRSALAAAASGRGDAISLDARQTLIEIYWGEFLERPIFGHGINTYHELAALNTNPANWEALRTSGSVHNIYVQALAESGAIGLVLLALALAPAVWRGARRATAGSEWAAGAVAMSALCFVQGLTDFGLQTPAIAALLAFALGAFVTTSQTHRVHDA